MPQINLHRREEKQEELHYERALTKDEIYLFITVVMQNGIEAKDLLNGINLFCQIQQKNDSAHARKNPISFLRFFVFCFCH
jgi:hypothetical protein